MNIKQKLIAIFFLVVIIPMAVLMYVSDTYMEQSIYSSYEKIGKQTAARIINNNLLDMMEDGYSYSQYLSLNPKIIIATHEALTNGQQDYLKKILFNQQEQWDISYLEVIDIKNGTVIASDHGDYGIVMPPERVISMARNLGFASKFEFNRDLQKYVIHTGTQIEHNGDVIATLHAGYIFDEITLFALSGGVGAVLYDTEFETYTATQKVNLDKQWVAEIFNNVTAACSHDSSSRQCKDLQFNVTQTTINDMPYIAVATPFTLDEESPQGTLVILQDATQMELDLSSAKQTITTIVSICVFTAILIAFVVARNISKPIVILKDAASSLGEGNFDTRVNIKSSDEIGILAKAFNEMGKKLGTTTVTKDYVENIIESMADALIVTGINNEIKQVNHATLKLLGYTDDEILAQKIDTILPDKDFWNEILLELSKTGSVRGRETILQVKNGETINIIISGASLYNIDHDPQGTVLVAQDITERKKAEKELQKSNRTIIDILESISDAFFALDNNWEITYLNQQAEKLLKAPRDKLLHGNLKQQLPNLPMWFSEAIKEAILYRSAVSTEGIYDRDNIWIELQVYPGQDGVSVYFRDITERKKAEERLSYLANYDALTDLPNRLLLLDRLNQSLTRAPWHERKVGIMFIDLDRFKIINDSLGHNIGDQLLKKVSKRILSCLRSGDTLARLGGDEFIVVLEDLAKVEDAWAIAQEIIDGVGRPLDLEGHEVYVTSSIGISIFPEDGKDPNVLLKNADLAMYRAKDEGKNRYHLYSQSMELQSSTRLTMENELRHAINREEFELYFQPQINLQTGKIRGSEALLRWNHPQRGLISPNEFLPIADETGLILPISEWVLRRACSQLKAWHDAGYTDLTMAVNISDTQFREINLPMFIKQVIKESGVNANKLELELTEQIVMHNAKNAMEVLHTLRDMGTLLSIDDFGTGYSSLSHLRRLPINIVKIDRSFIKDITSDEESLAITEAIIVLAKKLNLQLIAEGVETEEQREILIDMGCHMMQGYLCSPPTTSAKFFKLLQNYQKNSKRKSSI
jgi:diguanylate cyclase (GGDEF)-like protein/PAS domain S-box-containing protein